RRGTRPVGIAYQCPVEVWVRRSVHTSGEGVRCRIILGRRRTEVIAPVLIAVYFGVVHRAGDSIQGIDELARTRPRCRTSRIGRPAPRTTAAHCYDVSGYNEAYADIGSRQSDRAEVHIDRAGGVCAGRVVG